MVTDARAGALAQPVFVAVAVLAIYATRVTFRRSPVWLTTCLAMMVAIRAAAEIRSQHAILVQRSFYGQFRVTQTPGYTALYHGSTLHGAQSDEPGREREPLTYYVTGGP